MIIDMPAVKERPILMSESMASAAFDGKKTMTRRVCKKIPTYLHLGRPIMDWPLSGVYQEDDKWYLEVQTDVDDNSRDEIKCPYGDIGDRLWVRETWGCPSADHPLCPGGRKPTRGDKIFYRADPADAWQWRGGDGCGEFVWRPSIFMPRWACRTILEITEMRLERLHEMTMLELDAEGTPWEPSNGLDGDASRLEWFKKLWDKLNAKRGYPYDSNPFCWAVSFKRIIP
jgi:hypothetical protein